MQLSDRILAVGFEAEGELIDRSAFEASTPLSDYASVALDPAEVPALWRRLAADEGLALDDDAQADAGERLLALLSRRRREAARLLDQGGTLLCFLRPVGVLGRVPPRHEPAEGQPHADATRPIVLHAYAWLPHEPSLARLVIAGAHDAEIRPADEAHPAWRLIAAQAGRVRPVAAATNSPPPHWHAVATDPRGRLLAFEVPVGAGRVVFAPPLASEDPEERGRLLEAFFAAWRPAAGPGAQPPWMRGVLLPGQGELARRLATLAAQIERLEEEFLQARREHDLMRELNRLLSARSAEELAGPAAAAFGVLGFGVAAEAASLTLHSDEGSAWAVLAAAEEGIDTDAYWALVHRLDSGPTTPAKGVIVGNAFCSRPPSERGAPFRDLLCRGALHRSVCLLSTTELHAAVAEVMARPGDDALRSGFRKKILETVGPCSLVTQQPEEKQ